MKFAIFHCEEIPTLFLLEKAGKEAGFEMHLFHYKDIVLHVENGMTDLTVEGVSLKGFSGVFCRGFWSYENEVSLLVKFCEENSISVFDSALKHRQGISKMHDLYCFKSSGLAVPKTVFVNSVDDGTYGLLSRTVGFPMVAKEDKSRQGRDVFLLNTGPELEDFLHKIKDKANSAVFEFQEFIPADFDVRVIVIGGEVLGAIKRKSSDPREFRHNISLGGIAEQMQISQKMEGMAVKAAGVLNYEFAGVDIITNKMTGEEYILEVNRSPGFTGFVSATGIDLPKSLMNFFLRFLHNNLEYARLNQYATTAKNRRTFVQSER